MNSLLEQYPSGSISLDPQIYAVSLQETEVILNQHQYTSKIQAVDSRQVPEHHHEKLDNGRFVNGNMDSAAIDEEYKRSSLTEELVETSVSANETVVEAYHDAKRPAMDLVAEPFPLRSVANIVSDLDGESGEAEILVGNLEEIDSESMDLGNIRFLPLKKCTWSCAYLKAKSVDELVGLPLEINTVLICMNGEATLEGQNHSTTEESSELNSTNMEAKRDMHPWMPQTAFILQTLMMQLQLNAHWMFRTLIAPGKRKQSNSRQNQSRIMGR